MDESMLLRGVLGSVFGGRRKRSRRALGHLTGGLGGSLLGTVLSHPTAALTAAGVAWGIFETLQNQGGAATGQGGQWAGGAAPPNQPQPTQTLPTQTLPTQTWGPPSGGPAASVPPLPVASPPGVSVDVLRLVRLAVSAASADGAMSDQERAAVVEQAKNAGVADIVEQELQHRRPLAEIVGGVTDPVQRATLYVLAFTVLRADEAVNGAERIYLAQLAHLLNLDPPSVSKLEADTAARIDAAESS
jgi:uncharacterized membrane protein YebE (DUF533 family)